MSHFYSNLVTLIVERSRDILVQNVLSKLKLFVFPKAIILPWGILLHLKMFFNCKSANMIIENRAIENKTLRSALNSLSHKYLYNGF